MPKTLSTVLAALALAVVPATAAADEAPALTGGSWINASDLSLDRLRGKAVVLYFYEES